MNLEMNFRNEQVGHAPHAETKDEIKTLFFPKIELSLDEKRLHERSLRDAKEYMNAEAVILQDVCEIDDTKLYQKFGLTSTRAYCLKIMGLSAFIADSCIGVARKSKRVPELKEAIEDGELTVSTGIRIVSVLNEENKKEWLDKARTLSKNELERAVADEKPEVRREKLKPSSKGRSLLTISISEEFEAEIRRLQEVESKPNSGFASIEHVLQLRCAIGSIASIPSGKRNAQKSGRRIKRLDLKKLRRRTIKTMLLIKPKQKRKRCLAGALTKNHKDRRIQTFPNL